MIKQFNNYITTDSEWGKWCGPQRGRVYDSKFQSPSLSAVGYVTKILIIHTMEEKELLQMVEDNEIRIRKLTPRECFRLMGVSEENIDKIQDAGISKTQQYKMAGNSIVVDTMVHCFENLFFGENESRFQQMTLF
jgi:site-specific DNA-cytosine methylase